MSILVKQLDGPGYHLVWRYALAQATLYYLGTQLPSTQRGTAAPTFRPCSGPQAHILPITRIVDLTVRGEWLSWQSYR